jgi:D-cysteine desulfhydrase family pyridoxal phosphate-dependent enzyme
MPESHLPRLPLAHLPTPVEPLPRLGEAVGGSKMWIKRDDLTGLALGGNKTRKLELLLAEARGRAARTLVTTGAVQSNHCRQTAAAAARHGFECVLVLAGSRPDKATGNLLLDILLGAELRWTEGRDRETCLREACEDLAAQGRRPHLIPYGGSSPVGAAAYALALAEFLEQGLPVDRIVFASSSGGTQAGLVAGARIYGFPGRITGISIDQPRGPLQAVVARLAGQVCELLGSPGTFDPAEIEVIDSFLGEGYGVMGDLERRAIQAFARHEGILLDPVYTGRAAGGMLALLGSGAFLADERILFWHTGGTPALFPYADQLTSG